MKRSFSMLGLMAVLAFVVLATAAIAQDATAGQVQPAPVSTSTGQWTLYAVLALAVMQVSQWLKQLLDAQKERRAAAEAEAAEAEAKAEAKKAALVASLDPAQLNMLHTHETRIGQHDVEIAALKDSYRKYEKENRDDHGKIFNKLDDIRDMIAGRKPAGGAQ